MNHRVLFALEVPTVAQVHIFDQECKDIGISIDASEFKYTHLLSFKFNSCENVFYIHDKVVYFHSDAFE